MQTYILPFEETLRGWYEIEADSLEHAKQIAMQHDFTECREPEYRDGITDWDTDEIYLVATELRSND